MWLKSLNRYFQDKNQTPEAFGRLAGHWLTGQAQKVWDCELDDLLEQGKSPTWDYFVKTLTSYYGTVIPAREQRAKYLACAQKGTVMDFITEFKVITQTLKNTAFAPSQMDTVEHFIRGLKADVRKYVEEQAPQGWWTDPKPLFEKAIQFEVNQHSLAGKVQSVAKINHIDLKKKIGKKKAYRGRAGRQKERADRVPDRDDPRRPLHRIAKIVQSARKGRDVCLNCESSSHRYADCTSAYKEADFMLDAQKGNPHFSRMPISHKRKFG